ncbi:DUF6338 family protein [Deinococcus aluminii]|uniref:DUF6338 family protein n=1 Tax=Deinococcus aluminii TaxID=1656885 RepID=UPI0031F07D4D
MNTLSVLLASLLLLMPGFLGLSLLRYQLGIRTAEAQGTLLWSLLLSGVALLILLGLGQVFGWPLARSFLAVSLNTTSDGPTLATILILSFLACVLCTAAGALIGWRVRQRRHDLAELAGQNFSPDPWINLLGGQIEEPLVIVRMEDGRRYLGNALQASETASGRVIALKDTVMYASDDEAMRVPIIPLRPGTLIITSKIESVSMLDESLNEEVAETVTARDVLEHQAYSETASPFMDTGMDEL